MDPEMEEEMEMDPEMEEDPDEAELAQLLDMLGIAEGDLDEEDQQLINETGENDMSQILNAVGEMQGQMQEMTAKIDAINTQEQVPSAPIPPVVSSEPAIDPAVFSEEMSFNESSFHAQTAAIKLLVEEVNEQDAILSQVVDFCESLQDEVIFSEWQNAQVEKITEELEKLDFSSDEQNQIAFNQAYQFAEASLKGGVEDPDYKVYFSELSKLGVGSTVLPPVADDAPSGKPVDVNYIGFVEQSGDLQAIFSEYDIPLTNETAKLAVEAEKEYKENYSNGEVTKKYFIKGALDN